MMERFFYEKCGSEESYESLKRDPVFTFIRDLNFAYGLKVLMKLSDGAYQLVNNDGMAVCVVFTRMHDDKVQYNYKSPYYRKQRGDSEASKQTIFSFKVSSLMASIKRHKVVPNDLMERKSKLVTNAVYELRTSQGRSNKSHDLSPSEVQALLAHFLGTNTDKNFVDLDLDKCKIELDKMNRSDEVLERKLQEVKRFFTQGYWQFGVDSFGHLIVGKFKAINVDEDRNRVDIECIERFKRYVDPRDCAELAPLLTMIKVAYETARFDKAPLGIPIDDTYDSALDVVFYRAERPTRYDCQWVFTPMGGVL